MSIWVRRSRSDDVQAHFVIRSHRKIALQEIAVTGSYCYTPVDFRQTVAALAAAQFGKLRWFEQRSLSEGAGAFASIDAGSTAAAKIVLRP
jgi:hypothetical protein